MTAVDADATSLLYTDNVASLNKNLPIVDQHSSSAPADVATLKLNAVLVRVDSAATLERVRTFLTVTYPGLTSDATDSAPQTIGEVARVRGALYRELGQVVFLIVGLTLLVAGCSLAIAMGGGMIERKRPFTLLRVSGAAARVLRRVVLLESVLPLIAATMVAAIAGFAVAIPVGVALSPPGTSTSIRFPDHTYYLTMGAGLVISLTVIIMTLPLLNRVTMPANARFE
jgi:ABC-type antimicrobial peptide transport system permease subunit